MKKNQVKRFQKSTEKVKSSRSKKQIRSERDEHMMRKYRHIQWLDDEED